MGCKFVELGGSTAIICGGKPDHECDEKEIVYDFSDEELAAIKDKIEKEVWPEIKDEFGAELFDSIVGN